MPQFLHSTGDALQERRDATQARIEAERIQRERFSEFDPYGTAPIPCLDAPLWPEEAKELLPFFVAFAEGRTVWHYHRANFNDNPRWHVVEQLNVLGDPTLLSLSYNTDAPTVE